MTEKEKKLTPRVPREAVATPEQVRVLLDVTPEKETELRREQAKALKLFRSRARLSRAERKKGRGIELERHHQQTGNRDALAEALAMQGRFAEAEHIAINPELKAVFGEKRAAIEAPDADCECPTYSEENGLFIPNQFIESEVISDKHGGLTPAVRCRVCVKLNVRQMFPDLAAQRAARSRSVKGRDEVKATEFFKEAR
jgi:hypothetical protein